MNICNGNNVFTVEQYGLKRNRITQYAINELINKIIKYLNNRNDSATVFIDFSIAFKVEIVRFFDHNLKKVDIKVFL